MGDVERPLEMRQAVRSHIGSLFASWVVSSVNQKLVLQILENVC